MSDFDNLIAGYQQYLYNERKGQISNGTKDHYLSKAQSELEFRWQDIYNEPVTNYTNTEKGKLKLHKLMRTNYPKRYFSGLVSFSDYLRDSIHPNFLSENYMTTTYSKNCILYGPPGTGKTFNTVNKAIEIADPSFTLEGKNRKEIMAYFESLLFDEKTNPNGQIMFTTFHQSMSYEDFIEGIKPNIVDDEDDDENSSTLKDLDYIIKDGIFKQLVSLAKKKTKSAVDFDQLWSDYLNQLRNIEEEKLFTSVSSELRLEKEEISDSSIKVRFKRSWNPEEEEGTKAFIVSKRMIERLFDAKVDGSEENQKGRTDVAKLVGKGRATHIYSVYKDFYSYALSRNAFASDQSLNYVLIIDEINRGNVSSIFGELITLIEEDKRMGELNQLSSILPYSKERFSVPSNLYIIGTMNTADRSVEALDTALRRRFSFQERMPDPSQLEDKVIEGIDLKKLLETINTRIEALIDRDHTIGHAYLINVNNLKDLRTAFKDNIIPLLQEYFYGDYGKIGLVLGKGFVEMTPVEDNIFSSFEYEGRETLVNNAYELKSFEDIDFKVALQEIF